MPAPEMARQYYELPEGAKFRDIILSVRADESFHRDINHKLVEIPPECDVEQEVHDFVEKDDRCWREPTSSEQKITHNL